MLLDEAKYQGVWFVPSFEDKVTFSGHVTYSPREGINLELIPTFHKRLSPQDYDRLMRINFMYGKLTTEEYMTLYDVFCLQYPIFPVVSNLKYHANFGFIGNEFLEEQDLRFRSFILRFNLLDSWLPPGFKVGSFNSDCEVISFKPKKYSYELDRGKISFFSSYKRTDGIFRFEVNSLTAIKFKFKNYLDADIWRLLKTVYQIQIFLSLLGGKNFYPISLKAKTNTGKEVSILYSFNVEDDYIQKVPWHRFLFLFTRIKKFEEKIVSFFNSIDSLHIVYDLFYEYRFRKRILEEEFLNIVRALEVYHRIKFGGSNLPSWLFEVILDEIKKSLNNKLSQLVFRKSEKTQALKIISRINNEPSLDKRLKELYKFLKGVGYIRSLFGGSNNKAKNFLYRVYISRNYYTHFNESLKDKALSGIKLYKANKKLGIFLEALLLKEIGFEDSELDSAFKNNIDYEQLVREDVWQTKAES